MNQHRTEKGLVDEFVATLSAATSIWGTVRIAREFDYQRGRTDVVLVTECGTVVAFEAKLQRWREALHQAYRNRCFADASFVVLPKEIALAAARFRHEFDRRGVGICYYDADDGLVILHQGDVCEPLQPWLRELALTSVCTSLQADAHS